MARYFDIAIVGSGHAGAQTAISLRQHKFPGSIAILTADTLPPYERPPLSKDYLAGEKTFARMLIRPGRFWADKDIGILTGRRVRAVDPERHALELSDAGRVGYGKLVWAAGGSVVRLPCPGADLAGITYVRSRQDADAIRARLDAATDIVIVGGGYIGLEAAATLRKQGKKVTLVEAGDRVLGRVADVQISRFFEAQHRRHGVDLRTGAQVVTVEGRNGAVEAVTLQDGEKLGADLVIVGIGIRPEAAPLETAGADCANGVLVDEFCRTSLEDIYAIGDCASFRSAFADGRRVRVESVQNATGMAKAVARHLLGVFEPYAELPWFWSDQYDLKLQTVGLNTGYDATVLRGDPATARFSLVYLRHGSVAALDCVNSARDFVQGRRLIEAGARVAERLLADPDHPLKDALR